LKKFFLEEYEVSCILYVLSFMGINAQDDLLKVYSKFSKFSAKPTAKESSTGLGFSIVKKMTELLGGIVELKTEVDKGSTFKLSFIKA